MTFHHDAEDVGGPGTDLLGEGRYNGRLIGVLLAAVAVAAVNHQAACQAGRTELCRHAIDVIAVEIRAGVGAAQNHVTAVVAGGLDDGRDPLFGNAKEVMRALGGADCVDGDLDVAVRAGS